MKDPATWKDFGWTGLSGVVAFGLGLVALIAWGCVIGLISLPFWYWTPSDATQLGIYRVDTLPLALLTAAIGVALIPVAGYLVQGLTKIELLVMESLLRPSKRNELEERVERLTTTRAGAVDAQAAELQRIERDLHDGAQARIVALAMHLGMAEDKFESNPQEARALMADARAEAHTALTELRDLARGIHPPILSDRGLEAAITALAARSPLNVTIDAQLPDRLPAATEGAAYFVVAEALTNAAKHAQADRVLVRLTKTNDTLVVEVADDGAGGADPQGAGLTGLRRRVEALDGSLRVVSPRGSGTTLRAEVPCGS